MSDNMHPGLRETLRRWKQNPERELSDRPHTIREDGTDGSMEVQVGSDFADYFDARQPC